MNEVQQISRNVVVTGASSGIGRAIAERLQAEGWQPFNLDIKPPPEASSGGTWVETDLADTGSIRGAIARVLEHGRVSGLVNNAAIPGTMNLLLDTDEADMDRVYAVNMKAPMLCARYLAPSMIEQRYGRIVNIASRALLGKARRTSYGGTKGALVSMARCWALELAGSGVTCNLVAPGPVNTELFAEANPDHLPRSRKIVEDIPVGRLGEPEDIAQAVAFFMDRRSGFVTGQVLYVCGGVSLARGGS